MASHFIDDANKKPDAKENQALNWFSVKVPEMQALMLIVTNEGPLDTTTCKTCKMPALKAPFRDQAFCPACDGEAFAAVLTRATEFYREVWDQCNS